MMPETVYIYILCIFCLESLKIYLLTSVNIKKLGSFSDKLRITIQDSFIIAFYLKIYFRE